MYNSPTDLSDYENVTIESDILSLKSLLDEMDSWQNPTTYRVLEYFPPVSNVMKLAYSPAIYEVINLRFDIEDGVMYCNGIVDEEDRMLADELKYVLNAIVIDSIIMISIRNNIITMSLDDGYIRIEYSN